MFVRTKIFSAVFLLGLAPSATSAAGTSPVGWVSKQFGQDVPGCGAVTNPCKTLQFAFDNAVATGGTIAVRDAGGYGPLVINHSISIINESGVVAGIFGPPGVAIDIQAGSTDVVVIKGMTLEGAGTGTAGILATSVGELTVANCTVKGFSVVGGAGILISPTNATAFTVTDSFIVDDGTVGIGINAGSPVSIKGVIKNVFVSGSSEGIGLNSGPATPQLSIEDTVTTRNDYGVFGGGSAGSISAVRLESKGNKTGVFITDGISATLSRSRVIQNTLTDISIGFAGASVKSFGDNEVGTTNQALGSISYK
ncbi:hypothetical protein [Methylocystis parvus]|uniref:hypothetical protein n=1 Tax=Methylocystis parvus TaxID=134 RepID=UPI003C746C3F